MRILHPQKQGQAFLSHAFPYAVHIPLASKSKLVEKYRKRAKERKRSLPHPVYAGLVEEVDDQVGRIVRTLDTQGLTDDTMVVFTSDNGGLIKRYDYNERADDIVSDLAPLKGEKVRCTREASGFP